MRFFIFFIFFSLRIVYGQNGYVPIPKNVKIELVYKMHTDSFIDSYQPIQPINGIRYVLRVRTYSWNESDTAYFREDKFNFYACTDPYKRIEYIEIPKKPKVGQKWYNRDSSWAFTVDDTNAKLQTPYKLFDHLFAIKASQGSERNNQFTNYINYYSKEIGYVGSIVDGKVFNYWIGTSR